MPSTLDPTRDTTRSRKTKSRKTELIEPEKRLINSNRDTTSRAVLTQAEMRLIESTQHDLKPSQLDRTRVKSEDLSYSKMILNIFRNDPHLFLK